jgi:hypothetical protein
MMNSIARFSQNITRSFSSKPIPKEFGKHLSDLYKKGEYSRIVETIEKSTFQSDPALLYLSSQCLELQSQRLHLKSLLKKDQAEFFAKKNHTSTGLDPVNAKASLVVPIAISEFSKNTEK